MDAKHASIPFGDLVGSAKVLGLHYTILHGGEGEDIIKEVRNKNVNTNFAIWSELFRVKP